MDNEEILKHLNEIKSKIDTITTKKPKRVITKEPSAAQLEQRRKFSENAKKKSEESKAKKVDKPVEELKPKEEPKKVRNTIKKCINIKNKI
jgi:hypothetical protein